MLNRRYLRIKVMQALYGFFQAESNDAAKSEKEMFHSIEKIYDLYLYLMLLIVELRDVSQFVIEERKKKRLPTQEDMQPNRKFVDNPIFAQLSSNAQLRKETTDRKINWTGESELIRKLYNTVVNSSEYATYMKDPVDSYEHHRDFMVRIFENHIAESELLLNFFEEKSIYWADDYWLASVSVAKTLEQMAFDNDAVLLPLWKDKEDDRQFVADLFRKSIVNNKENEQLVSQRTKNWEVERIAMMDILLMKMGLTELCHFSSIPVKVTLNEYIEISKLYSTPMSRVFINGILDKLVLDLKATGQIAKIGRGLME